MPLIPFSCSFFILSSNCRRSVYVGGSVARVSRSSSFVTPGIILSSFGFSSESAWMKSLSALCNLSLTSAPFMFFNLIFELFNLRLRYRWATSTSMFAISLVVVASNPAAIPLTSFSLVLSGLPLLLNSSRNIRIVGVFGVFRASTISMILGRPCVTLTVATPA